MHRLTGCTLVAICSYLLCNSAHSYIVSRAKNGDFLKWSNPYLRMVGHPSNQSALSHDWIQNVVIKGLRRWEEAGKGALSFDYWQGTEAFLYVPNALFNGQSSFYFASNDSTGNPPIGPYILGLTQVWYNTENGEILEADVVLNDIHYEFTSDPEDTSGPGSGNSISSRKVFIENVLTHELGHAYGMAHSGNLQSTMLYMEAPDQAHLSCDDQLGVREAYGGEHSAYSGGLRGRVTRSSGMGVFGAHVVALSKSRGVAIASTLTEPNGEYEFKSLEPGDYNLLVEPYYPSTSTLPEFYTSMPSLICLTSPFSRTFLTDEAQHLQTISVSHSNVVTAPEISVSCQVGSGAAVSSILGGSATWNAYSLGQVDFDAWVDRFPSAGSTLYYQFVHLGGQFVFRAMSYSLYSPIGTQVDLLSSSGDVVYSEQSNAIYTGESGYRNFDSSLDISFLPSGTYYLRLNSFTLNQSHYPGGGTAIDSQPFVVASIGSGNENISKPTQPGALKVNAKCRMKEDFPPYESPSVFPPVLEEGSSDAGFLGCGTVAVSSSAISRSQSLGALLGWLFQWLFSILGYLGLRFHSGTSTIKE